MIAYFSKFLNKKELFQQLIAVNYLRPSVGRDGKTLQSIKTLYKAYIMSIPENCNIILGKFVALLHVHL